MTRPRMMMAWIGSGKPVAIYVPAGHLLTEHEILPAHQAFAMRGYASVVAIWNAETRAWVGFSTVAVWWRVAGEREIHKVTPDELNQDTPPNV